MKTFEVSGNLREGLGKKETKKLRAEDKIPCVLYGTDAPVHFSCDSSAVRKLIYTPNVYLVELDIDGKKHQAIMQDVQFHPVEEMILHIDFLSVSDEKLVKVNIPVVTKGYAVGLKAGGKLQLELRRLTVLALPKDLPDTIEIDVTNIELGESFRVGDIADDKLTILNGKSVPVVRVMITRAAKAAGDTIVAGDAEATEES
ncbi:MAG: 50S ribosomal protein L25/general stress protein Ctc [Prolixibacteraceae bacterium]|jgi:large subunit ribosomal protein L25|nr:50S ribosomal protein L25/general stress protein Ctc [Prolixibacteraceae bacterium]